jgi:UDP-glucose 4-epimerase
MRILITGGAGFIGSHLADSLLERGDSVTVIDDLSTGSINNISHLKDRAEFRYVIDSVMNIPLLAELVDETDVVYHLAAAVGVRLIVESPVRTINTNIGATELVLQMASKKKKKVMITSTSEVYGKSTKLPFQEDDDLVMGAPVRGRWSYACSKAIDEFLALAYFREKKLPTIIVRLFNTVGPRQTGMYGMVIPTFVQQALGGSPLTIHGDGEQSRCFTYVGDVVNALLRLMETPDAIGRIFNIGSDQEVTINELAARVLNVTGSSSRLEYQSYDAAYGAEFEDMMRRVPDLTRIRQTIGYRTTKDLNDIIATVAEYQHRQKRLPWARAAVASTTAAAASAVRPFTMAD